MPAPTLKIMSRVTANTLFFKDGLTYISPVDFSIFINSTSLFPNLGVSGALFILFWIEIPGSGIWSGSTLFA